MVPAEFLQAPDEAEEAGAVVLVRVRTEGDAEAVDDAEVGGAGSCRWVAVGGGMARYVGIVVLRGGHDVVKQFGGDGAASGLGVLVEGWLECCYLLPSREPTELTRDMLGSFGRLRGLGGGQLRLAFGSALMLRPSFNAVQRVFQDVELLKGPQTEEFGGTCPINDRAFSTPTHGSNPSSVKG